MPSHNFLQFNPTAANQESDAAYSSDTLRSGGAANSALLPAITFNKLMFQLSTMVAALAQAMVNKGFTLSDANLSTLTSAVQNIMTTADMSPYAQLIGPNFTSPTTGSTPASGQANSAIPNTYWVDQYFAKLSYLNSTFLTLASAAATYATNSYVNGTFAPNASPALTGNPTAPTQANGDNSTRLATTAFIKNQNYQPALGFTPIQQGNGGTILPNKIYLGYDGAGGIRVQVDGNDTFGTFALRNQFSGSIGTSAGWSRMSNGQLIQWGTGATDGSYVASYVYGSAYPVSFASAPCLTMQLSNSGATSDTTTFNAVSTTLTGFNWSASQNGIHAFFWIAIGS